MNVYTVFSLDILCSKRCTLSKSIIYSYPLISSRYPLEILNVCMAAYDTPLMIMNYDRSANPTDVFIVCRIYNGCSRSEKIITKI